MTILNFGALRAPAELRRLHAAHPDTHVIVLANHPTPGECSQLIALGATACLGKDVQGRDVLNAIHLASRGMHVLPHARPASAAGLLPDVVHTSLLRRAISTANLALDTCDRHWIPVRRDWRLNERHYGALQGKDKKQTLAEFGE